MGIFDQFKKSSKITSKVAPRVTGLIIHLYDANNKKIDLPLSNQKSKELVAWSPDIARAIFDIEGAVRQIGSIQIESTEDQVEFNKEDLSAPNCILEDGGVLISYKLISAIRFGTGTELTGLTSSDLLTLGVPKYSELRLSLRSERTYKDQDFRFSLKIYDTNGNEIILDKIEGHYLIDSDDNTFFMNPLAISLVNRVNEHLSNRKTPQYKSDVGVRIKDFSRVRETALEVKARLDDFVKSEEVLFLDTLPYELGRDLEGELLVAPRLPTSHKKDDLIFERAINSADDINQTSHINIIKNEKEHTSKRVFLSNKAKETFGKIRQFNSSSREIKESLAEEPEEFFGHSPRENIGESFSERVSGFIIGKIRSNRSDIGSKTEWDKGFDEESALLRTTDNSTVKIQFKPTPKEYSKIKEIVSQLKEKEVQIEIDKRNETGALLTPIPREATPDVYIDCLNGEFSRAELERFLLQVETSNVPDLEEDEFKLANERVSQASKKNSYLVNWGEEGDEIPLSSLKRSLTKEKCESQERVSLAIDNSTNNLGNPPNWHWTTPDDRWTQPVPGFKQSVSLWQHQQIGYSWLRWIFEHTSTDKNEGHRGALIADDMGLGKTIQVIALISHVKSLENIKDKPILVIAPLGLIQTSWLKDGLSAFLEPSVFNEINEGSFQDIANFSNCPFNPDLKISKEEAERVNRELAEEGKTIADCSIDSTIKDDLKKVAEWCKGKLIITSYETARNRGIALAAVDFSLVILDEAQKIKNSGSLQSNSVKALKGDMYIAMTGTPIENSLMDLWGIMDFVLPGHLGSQSQFRTNFVRRVKGLEPGSEDREIVRKELEQALLPVWMRRTKKEIYGKSDKLPEAIHHDSMKDEEGNIFNEHAVKMSEEQEAIYSRHANLYQGGGSGLNALRGMLEACSSPWLAVTNLKVIWSNKEKLFSLSPKLKATIEILERIRSNTSEDGQKVIIFANTRAIQRDLAFFIYDWNRHTSDSPIEVEVYNGEIPEKMRGAILDRFKTAPGFSVVIISPRAGGVGLNLTEANHVIHFTREWNPALERQATDRVYRLKQTRTVHVYYPISLGRTEGRPSAEEHLAELLRGKREIMDDFTISNKDADPTRDFSSSFEGNSSGEIIHPDAIGSLNHKDFEAYIACLYEKKLDFKTYVVGGSKDRGVDVIALNARENLLIQVKHSSCGNKIGTKAIQEIRGARSSYEKTTEKDYILVAATNSNFNIDAQNFSIQGDEVKLVNGAQILEMASDIKITMSDIIKKLQEKPDFQLP